MTNADLYAWASGGAALAAALVAWFPWMRGQVNADMFTKMMLKLLAAGNPDRAAKLCNAAPNAPFVVACGAALKAIHVDSKGQPESEVRINGREAFDKTLGAELSKAGALSWVALIAAAFAGLCGYFVLIQEGSPWALTLAGVGLFAIFMARKIAYSIAIAAGTHRDALIDAMVSARSAT